MSGWRAPAAALSLAAAVALGPVMVSAPATVTAHPLTARPAMTSVHIDDIRLAGIGQDIYYAITPTVQYVVGGGSYLINFVPLVGGVIAAQININYFQGIQPVVEATVNALAGVVQNPLNIIGTLSAYGSTLYDIGYNWVSAELQWLGLAPLPPLPPLAAVRGSSTPQAAVRAAAGPRIAAALAAGVPVVGRGDLRRPARAAAGPGAAAAKADAAPRGRSAAARVAGHARGAAKVASG